MALQGCNIVLCRREPQLLTLDMLAARAGMHPALVQQLAELGLIEPVELQGATTLYDASAVPRLRMILRLRKTLGINLAGIAVILDLRDRFCALQLENERLRSGL